MHDKGKLFVLLVVLGAALFWSYLWTNATLAPELIASRDVAAVLCFAGIALVAEGMAVDFRIGIGPRQPQASVAFLPFISGILIFPPLVAVALVAVVVAISQAALRRSDWVRGPFNVAQSILSSGTAALVYHVATSSNIPELFAFVPLVVTFFATNVALSSVAIALLRDLPLRDVLGKVAGPRGSNLLYDFVVSPLALVPAAVYETTHVMGLMMTVLPILAVRWFYTAKQEALQANDDLLFVLVKAIETRDPYTSGHSVRVRALAQAIATDMQLPESKIQMVAKAALLHDIGKIDADYAAVIRKPHDLTPEERSLIQTHAVRGAELLENLSSVSAEIVLGVRHHHERYDGKGYPAGLVGDEIPLAGRIIMICDSVDAMLSDRPYRKALPVEAVRQELERCAGTQFDPHIVEIMLSKGTLERAAETASKDRPEPAAHESVHARLQAVG
jgi:putative nucleotidyltransferase with HDIG domain